MSSEKDEKIVQLEGSITEAENQLIAAKKRANDVLMQEHHSEREAIEARFKVENELELVKRDLVSVKEIESKLKEEIAILKKSNEMAIERNDENTELLINKDNIIIMLESNMAHADNELKNVKDELLSMKEREDTLNKELAMLKDPHKTNSETDKESNQLLSNKHMSILEKDKNEMEKEMLAVKEELARMNENNEYISMLEKNKAEMENELLTVKEKLAYMKEKEVKLKKKISVLKHRKEPDDDHNEIALIMERSGKVEIVLQD